MIVKCCALLRVVLRPGFEPGSAAREAVILNRTILPEHFFVSTFYADNNLTAVTHIFKAHLYKFVFLI